MIKELSNKKKMYLHKLGFYNQCSLCDAEAFVTFFEEACII